MSSLSRRCSLSLFMAFIVLNCLPMGARSSAAEPAGPRQLFFTSQGKTALINADGTGLKYFDFKVPNQATWQPGPSFPDQKRVIFLSMEPRRDGPGKPFDEYYTQTPTHIWLHDLQTGSLDELCTKDRICPFETPALLVGEDRLLVQVVKNRVGWITSMKLDGSDAKDFTKPGEGLPYGFSLSPDRKRVAFHLAGPPGYQVYTSDIDGSNRTLIASQAGHLFFGPVWSPDGKWLAYIDCVPGEDPGHDWGEICVGRPDGSQHKVLTKGKAMWFAATYGIPGTKGGGSNLPAWTNDGKILFPMRSPGSEVVWQYRVGKPDLDHFNRDYKPEASKGGVHLVKMDPETGAITELTKPTEKIWDFRVSESPDAKQIVFCRAPVGDVPSIWVMDPDGKNARPITKGIDNKGVDHPRWVGK
ncbi:MAG: serine/threonine protein kinase [Planctomycetales bacterium]